MYEPEAGPGDGTTLGKRVKRTMITGIAVTVPLIVTLFVVGFVVNFVSGALNPLVGLIESIPGLSDVSGVVVKIVALLGVLIGMFLIGLVTERQPADRAEQNSFDRAMERLPGIGSIYTSFNEMSQLLLESDTDSFQEVKLVEFPSEGSYAIAFVTAETPETVTQATDHGPMETLFLPMAPNPVMGGHVISVEESRVIDVDMTVEEGIRTIVTSGVAFEELGAQSPAGTQAEKRVDDDTPTTL